MASAWEGWAMLLYCTFLGSIRVRVWSNLGMSWGSSGSLLCISQVQLIFSYHNAFSHSLFSINFLQLQKKGTLAKEEFLLQVSQKIIFVCSLVSFKEGHSVSSTLKSDNALSPGLQNSYPDNCHQSFQLGHSSNPYPTSPRVSQQSEKSSRPTQPTSFGADSTTVFNVKCSNLQKSAFCWQIHLKFGYFFHSLHQLSFGAFLGHPWN